ncbi:hypothetical protein SAMN04487849_103200 [Micrococcus luteus]|uniref:Heparan-alpha-glucosaminide N-acetyltransferase catalytic domain-containing protein n=1 Tax=Micrococcus luteus TaxID=1270 RepID=A0ABD7M6Q8_MICLU|nr:hypothetical protein [Micrococcus luteus]SHL47222.1 hypothetical protein SAMN04487849_103200 [Micrococcus luteus]
MPAPSSHAPAATHTARGRLVWVDVARGLALVAMMVAHAAPAGGPDGVLRLAEHLTAPLFAALVGVGARLEAERLGPRRSVPRGLVRAAALCGAAWLTGHLGAEVTDVLAHLAVLTVVMALLAALPLAAHLVLAVLAGGGGLLLAATPTADVVDRLVPLAQALGLSRATLTPWVSAFLTDGPFRLPLFLAWALLGAVLVATVHGTTTVAPARRARLTGLAWAAGGIALAGVVLALSRTQTGAAPAPSAATPAEALLVTGLVLTVLGGCAALAPPRAGLLAVPGAMTLSVYAAHLWYLGWVRRLGPGPWRSDTGTVDTWFNLAVLVAGALLLPPLWRAVVRIGPFRAGPLEGVVRLLTAPFDRAR